MRVGLIMLRQEMVIRELLRVLKINGLLLITGKNNNYFDDEAAVIAEVNARKKGHPNYFTDIGNLKEQLRQHGVGLIAAFYFLRKRDFPKNQAIIEMPDRFYVWAFVVKKSECYKELEYQKFSDKFSKHFR